MYLIFVTHSYMIQCCDLVVTSSTTNWVLFKWTKQVTKMNSRNQEQKQTKKNELQQPKQWNNKRKWRMRSEEKRV
jgi:hypothetical protein